MSSDYFTKMTTRLEIICIMFKLLVMRNNLVTYFYIEVIAFLVLLGIFTLIPMTQLTLQGSTFALAAYCFIVSRHNKISLEQLGLTRPSKDSLTKWFLITLLMGGGILLLKFIFPDGLFNGVSKNRQSFVYLIPFYILIGTFFQEFIFRGYVFARTHKLFPVGASVMINIALFSIFHLPYLVQFRSNLIYLSMAAGVCWSLMYAKYPNLYLAWASHAIVGSLNLLLLQRF